MFEKIEKFVSCACVSIMAVLVFSNVIARFLFKHSLAVSDEMSTYLFVLMSFMGTAIAARRRAHLGLSIITDHVSPHTRLIIQLVMYGQLPGRRGARKIREAQRGGSVNGAAYHF